MYGEVLQGLPHSLLASASFPAMNDVTAGSSAYPDPRQRGKITFNAPKTSNALSSRIPTDLLLALILTKTTIASSALLARHWLLVPHSEGVHTPHSAFGGGSQPLLSDSGDHGQASAWAVATLAFLLASLGQGLWFRVWQWTPSLRRSDPNMKVLPRRLGMLALVYFAHLVVWLLALQHLGATTVILFTQFCEVWASDLVRSVKTKSYGGYTILMALCLSFLWTLVTGLSSSTPSAGSHVMQNSSRGMTASKYDYDEDLPPSLRHTRPSDLGSPTSAARAAAQAGLDAAGFSPGGVLVGHLWLLAFAFLTLERERATGAASKESGGRRRATVLAALIVAAVATPASLLGAIFVSHDKLLENLITSALTRPCLIDAVSRAGSADSSSAELAGSYLCVVRLVSDLSPASIFFARGLFPDP